MAHKGPSFTALHTTLNDGVYVVTFNRPTVKNAFNSAAYQEIILALEYAKSEPGVHAVVFTGAGDFFSSGNDLRNFQQNKDVKDGISAAKQRLLKFVDAFITFPKPLIAGVNGNAIGIGCTMLAHFDLVYAFEKATFRTPFTELGQTPEACSSVLFPQLLGQRKAYEMLVLGKTFSASELNGSFVTEIFPDSKGAVNKALEAAQILANSPQESVINAKRLLKANSIELLQRANSDEVDELGRRWVSPECFEAIMKFLTRRAPKPTAKL